MKILPNQTTSTNAPKNGSSNPQKFSDTDNRRHLCVIDALSTWTMPCERLARWAGCSKSTELVAKLRLRGFEISCKRVSDIDRDGLPIKRGVYYFTEHDRRKVNRWLSTRSHI